MSLKIKYIEWTRSNVKSDKELEPKPRMVGKKIEDDLEYKRPTAWFILRWITECALNDTAYSITPDFAIASHIT
jgi:hypothetical protein